MAWCHFDWSSVFMAKHSKRLLLLLLLKKEAFWLVSKCGLTNWIWFQLGRRGRDCSKWQKVAHLLSQSSYQMDLFFSLAIGQVSGDSAHRPTDLLALFDPSSPHSLLLLSTCHSLLLVSVKQIFARRGVHWQQLRQSSSSEQEDVIANNCAICSERSCWQLTRQWA